MSNRAQKGLLTAAAVGLLIFVSGALLADRGGVYHPSFYAIFSNVTWGGFLVALVGGALSLLLATERAQPFPYWKRSATIVGVSYAVFFSLPRLVGMRFWAPPRSDSFNHISDARYILEHGSIPPGDMYPMVHVLTAALESISNLPTEPLLIVIPLAISGCLILGVTTLSGRISASKQTALFTLFVTLPLVWSKYHSALFPWFAAFALVPIGLLLIQISDETINNRLATVSAVIVIAAAMVPFHPMTAGVFTICLGVFALTSKMRLPKKYVVRSSTTVAGMVIVVALPFWYLTFVELQQKLVTIILGLFAGGTGGGATRLGAAGETAFTLQQIIVRYVILDYGVALAYVGMAALILGICILVPWVTLRNQPWLIVAGGVFAAGIGLAGAMLVTNLIVTAEVYRMNQLSLLGAVLILGYTLTRLGTVQNARLRQLGHVAVVGVVLFGLVFSPFTVYDAKQHVIESEFTGTEWFLNNRVEDVDVRALKMSHKQTTYLLGLEGAEAIYWQNWAFRSDADHQTPRNLGYRDNQTIQDSVGGGYVITKTRDTKWYVLEPKNRWPELNYYTDADLNRLYDDRTASKIFTNGGFETWKVINETK